ncbi:ATP-dependent DNA ligase [Blastococcus sp. Marseille-P5729]|uniref:ATP-dependent DNA ligase n=1 Tax=Blastococcus sp. Marseille-P5729 TaxID=2086582 RepID=UPI000D1110CA|nr:ATP-dependent DNA ligase [Blastococcus sp. Marseille-P5729]
MLDRPLSPALAKPAKKLPVGGQWVFEPKWDGFRAIVRKQDGGVIIDSRSGNDLTRYFPELVRSLRDALPDGCAVDGEIVIEVDGRLSFDSLQARLHPAQSRIERLAGELPAAMVIFDLLAHDGRSLLDEPLRARRALLDDVLGAIEPPLWLTPFTMDAEAAQSWFTQLEGAGLDGLIAKDLDAPYEPGVRSFLKLKHRRDLDTVVCGFRWHKSGDVVGSLMLGLYDDDGALHYIGACSSFTAKKRSELVGLLEPYRCAPADHPWGAWAEQSGGGERMPGGQSRWSAGKDLSWVPVRPELVAEIAYDQFQGPRLRHLGTFVRWRPDREPRSCTFGQVPEIDPYPLDAVLREQPG